MEAVNLGDDDRSDTAVAPLLSIVVPCLNEAPVLSETCTRLIKAAEEVVGGAFELILIDDGSRDATWGMITSQSERDDRIMGIHLSRNFGHQIALSAGLSHAAGDRILIIDADLQDPPELLPEMMALMDQGADVVYGQRRRRDGDGIFKRVTAAKFYRLLSHLSEVPIPVDTGDFRLMSRRALIHLMEMPERFRFVRGMVAWIGLRQVPIIYDRSSRRGGESKYPLSRMLCFALDAATSFSIRPLRLSYVFAAVNLLIALILAAYVIASLIFAETAPGWASILSAVVFFQAGQFVMFGLVGEYVGRTYMEVKRRPLFVVADTVGFRDSNRGSGQDSLVRKARRAQVGAVVT